MQIDKKTISDFGSQWTRYTSNDGFYASDELFNDILCGLVSDKDIRNKVVLDVGSGTGRIIEMIARHCPACIVGIEPSDAYYPLVENIKNKNLKNVEVLNVPAENYFSDNTFDLAISLGVIHHIENPMPVMLNIFRSLKANGRFVMWVYGYEGNETYLKFVEPIRALTTLMPHWLLNIVVWSMYFALIPYYKLSRCIKLPLSDYLSNVLFKMTPNNIRLVIYDQLNPKCAKYYKEEEARDLMVKTGFRNVEVVSRRGYSWTVIGTR